MQPEDFKFVQNINLIYRGPMQDIPRGLTEEEINEYIEKYKSYDTNEFSKKKKRKKWDWINF